MAPLHEVTNKRRRVTMPAPPLPIDLTSDAEDDGERAYAWSCPKCTFHNRHDADVCSMCAARPSSEERAVAAVCGIEHDVVVVVDCASRLVTSCCIQVPSPPSPSPPPPQPLQPLLDALANSARVHEQQTDVLNKVLEKLVNAEFDQLLRQPGTLVRSCVRACV